MNATCEKVLRALEEKRRGITWSDFPTGFRLGARIFDLREVGYKIVKLNDVLPSGCVRARYVLQGGPKRLAT